MTDADLQKMLDVRIVQDGARQRVFYLPDDVILNTMKAFATTYDDPTGYSGGELPTGRYFAPINSNGCIQVYDGACYDGNGGVTPASTPIHHYVNGPRFVRFDMGITKRIDLTSRIYSELRIEALNVFNAVNFYGLAFPGSSLDPTNYNSYQITSAYRDSSGTQDPGGRLLQLSYRISF